MDDDSAHLIASFWAPANASYPHGRIICCTCDQVLVEVRAAPSQLG